MSVSNDTLVGGSMLTRGRSSSTRMDYLGSMPFILMHVACVAAFYTGVDATVLVLCFGCYFIRMFGITAGYHRYFASVLSHESVLSVRVGVVGLHALQKGPLWWAAHHRHHHRYSDTDEDVHSPLTSTIWWSHVGWIVSPKFNHTNWRLIRDMARFPELQWLNRNHWIPGLLLAVSCYLIGGATGLVWGFFVSTVLLYHGTFTVNSLCHLFGKRHYQTTDDSRNNWFVALITLGEGWHNNHHYYQSSANQGFFWWEVDISYYIIRALSVVGLVWDVRRPSARVLRGELHQRPAIENASTRDEPPVAVSLPTPFPATVAPSEAAVTC